MFNRTKLLNISGDVLPRMWQYFQNDNITSAGYFPKDSSIKAGDKLAKIIFDDSDNSYSITEYYIAENENKQLVATELEGKEKKKYGASVSTFLGNTSNNGMLAIANEQTSLDFGGVKTIASQALMYKFINTNVQSADFKDLEKVHTPSAMEEAFTNSSLNTLNIPKLEELSGAECCKKAFYNTGLQEVEFEALKKISGRACLEEAFAKCRHLTSLFFPALENSFGVETGQFHNMLLDVNNCTVHFPIALQSVLSAWQDVQDSFGGTNITILYDL